MDNLQDLHEFRSNFAPVMNELAEWTDSRRLVVSDNPRRLRNRLDNADQQTSSMYNENISRKDYYSMGDSYIHNSYRTAVENDEVRNPNQCPKFQSHLVQSPGSPLSVRRQRRPLPRSQNSPPNCEFISLEELHRVIRGLKPVNIPRDTSSNVEDCQPWKAAPELLSSNVQEYQPWKAAPELLSSRDSTRNIAANYPRRSDVPDGAIVSLAELQTAIQLLKPVSKVSDLTENNWNQSLPHNNRSLHDIRCDLTPKTASIKQEELKDQKDFKTNPITVEELELRIKSLKRVGGVYYPQLKTTFYEDIKQEHNEKFTKEGEQMMEIQTESCDHHGTCDEICKVDTDEVDVGQVTRRKKRSFLSRLKFWRKGSKETKQTTCEVMTSENSDKGQENATKASKEKTPSISAKSSSLFCCCVKGVSTDDSI
ncbi:uncharacterized protein LOC126809724 [Patella vulgata]|uniref:uncharacterized protein LOC126809724 n=1 Tax=Patella vulgata TaxID=6465 RepID=UPI0024A8CA77|nr:uncharacterized protein LOC126809724 [Patella vulgata]